MSLWFAFSVLKVVLNILTTIRTKTNNNLLLLRFRFYVKLSNRRLIRFRML